MTSHDARPSDGRNDSAADTMRSEHEHAQPAHPGSPLPENLGELHEAQSRLTLEGDAYGAFGIDSGPGSDMQTDERLHERIRECLSHDRRIDISDVTIEVSDGCVTLEGTIPELSMNAMIEDLVGKTPDVKTLSNRIQVPSSGGAHEDPEDPSSPPWM